MFRIHLFILLLCIVFKNYAQQNVAKNIISNNLTEIELKNDNSNIETSTLADSVLFKLKVKNANYDVVKNNLPYYVISKTTEYSQNATPTLIIKQTKVVNEPHASVIRNYLLKFLTYNFELISESSLCKTQNLNHYKLIPFRLNNQDQIEELMDYDVNWTISSVNNRLSNGLSKFANTSVLAAGNWYKIALAQTGVYKLDKEFFKAMGIDISTLNPKNIRIYGNGGKMTPERNSDFRYDDLQENAIQVIGEDDGVFDNNDYVLFYATGTTKWNKVREQEV